MSVKALGDSTVGSALGSVWESAAGAASSVLEPDSGCASGASSFCETACGSASGAASSVFESDSNSASGASSVSGSAWGASLVSEPGSASAVGEASSVFESCSGAAFGAASSVSLLGWVAVGVSVEEAVGESVAGAAGDSGASSGGVAAQAHWFFLNTQVLPEPDTVARLCLPQIGQTSLSVGFGE